MSASKKIFNLNERIRKNLYFFDAQCYLFTCFVVVYLGLPFHFWSRIEADVTNVDIFLRGLASFFAFLLLFRDLLPKKYQKFFPLYWYFILWFCLPFFSSYMFLISHISFAWVFLSIFLLGILVNWSSFLGLSISGIFCGFLLVFACGKAHLIDIQDVNESFSLYTGAMIVVVVSFFLKTRDNMLYERLEAYSELSRYVAHEMRKPLAFVKSGSNGFIANANKLFSGYQKAFDAGLIKEEVDPLTFNSLKKIPKEFQKSVSDGLLFIDILLAQTQKIEPQREFILSNAQSCLARVKSRWELGPKRKAPIHVNKDYDFQYCGNPLLLEYCLFEILRNSEYFVDQNKSPEIRLWCQKNGSNNEIHIKDNGQGIHNDDLRKILKKTFSKRKYGTGVGLAFCNRVMLEMSGELKLISELGEFTEVVLVFPATTRNLRRVI